jgi:acetyl-CoA carboxylase biotin carboxyl carrier protein
MVRLPDNRGEDRAQEGVPSLAALSHEVKELVRLISSTDISELHLESGSVRITIKRGGQPAGSHPGNVHTPPASLPESQSAGIVSLIGNSPAHGEEPALDVGEQLLVAPMVGTFYAAPAPNEPPYVAENDLVEPGQKVGIIEAMKMMNPVQSELAGRVTRILVQNAQPVEYGQPLMVIQTNHA